MSNVERVRGVVAGVPVCLGAFDAMQHSKDDSGPFLQEANFAWLTGIHEPGWRCLVTADTFYLCAPEIDDIHRTFAGGLSEEEALKVSGADEIVSTDVFNTLLAAMGDTIYALGDDPHQEYYTFAVNPAPRRLWTHLEGVVETVKDCRTMFARLRAIKTPEEIGVIRKAIAVTIDAFEHAQAQLKEGAVRYEYELEAEMTYVIRISGATGHAYAPIVASGKNALTLHYAENNHPLPKDGLVLIDVGAQVDGFAADITRTLVVGAPTDRERVVHEAVQHAQAEVIRLIKPGVLLAEYQEQSDKIMKRALKELGLFTHPGDFRKYFPHAISHGLGMDVHESLGGFKAFMPGMVLTVEPGIYIPEEGIGVRIEDDILVTEEGHENLSAALSVRL